MGENSWHLGKKYKKEKFFLKKRFLSEAVIETRLRIVWELKMKFGVIEICSERKIRILIPPVFHYSLICSNIFQGPLGNSTPLQFQSKKKTCHSSAWSYKTLDKSSIGSHGSRLGDSEGLRAGVPHAELSVNLQPRVPETPSPERQADSSSCSLAALSNCKLGMQ